MLRAARGGLYAARPGRGPHYLRGTRCTSHECMKYGQTVRGVNIACRCAVQNQVDQILEMLQRPGKQAIRVLIGSVVPDAVTEAADNSHTRPVPT